MDRDPIGSSSGSGWLLFTSRTKDHRGHFNIVSQELCCPTKAEYICADHSVTFIFRLRQSGGPYMPISPYPRNSYQRLLPFDGRNGEQQPEPRRARQPGSSQRDFYHRLWLTSYARCAFGGELWAARISLPKTSEAGADCTERPCLRPTRANYHRASKKPGALVFRSRELFAASPSYDSETEAIENALYALHALENCLRLNTKDRRRAPRAS